MKKLYLKWICWNFDTSEENEWNLKSNTSQYGPFTKKKLQLNQYKIVGLVRFHTGKVQDESRIHPLIIIHWFICMKVLWMRVYKSCKNISIILIWCAKIGLFNHKSSRQHKTIDLSTGVANPLPNLWGYRCNCSNKIPVQGPCQVSFNQGLS